MAAWRSKRRAASRGTFCIKKTTQISNNQGGWGKKRRISWCGGGRVVKSAGVFRWQNTQAYYGGAVTWLCPKLSNFASEISTLRADSIWRTIGIFSTFSVTFLSQTIRKLAGWPAPKQVSFQIPIQIKTKYIMLYFFSMNHFIQKDRNQRHYSTIHNTTTCQCSGSVAFWSGSGYPDPCQWITDTDPDPDPALQGLSRCQQKICFFSQVFFACNKPKLHLH